MSSAVSSTTAHPQLAKLALKIHAANERAEPPKAPVAAAGTTVTLSSAAQAAMAAAKEASETPAQTAQEARGNDTQAQRLLARQAAAKAAQG